jgi:hypothetical protein
MASKTTKSKNGTGSVALTLEHLRRGGDRAISSALVPELTVDGLPGLVYFKPLTVATVNSFIRAQADGTEKDVMERAYDILTNHLCDDKGKLIATRDELDGWPMSVAMAVMQAITRSIQGAAEEAGKV